MSDFHQMFAYNHWANLETAGAIERVGAPGRPLSLLSHLVASEALWMARMLSQPQPMPVWPELDLTACKSEFARLGSEWENFLDAQTEDSLARGIDYINSKGDAYTTAVRDILTHVITHAGYHRGQISTLLRLGGYQPTYTDYIEYVRKGPGA